MIQTMFSCKINKAKLTDRNLQNSRHFPSWKKLRNTKCNLPAGKNYDVPDIYSLQDHGMSLVYVNKFWRCKHWNLRCLIVFGSVIIDMLGFVMSTQKRKFKARYTLHSLKVVTPQYSLPNLKTPRQFPETVFTQSFRGHWTNCEVNEPE